MLSDLKRRVVGRVTTLWSAAGRVAGRVGRWRPAPWDSPGGVRVLVIAPHPDDEMGCGGALLLHTRAGDSVHLAHITDGRRSRALPVDPNEMASRRRKEAAAAATIMHLGGADWLGVREGEWEEPALVPRLEELLRRTLPDIVYAPSRVDFHPEHVRVARCLARAISTLGLRTLNVRVYQMQVPLTPVLVNCVASLPAVAEQLSAAMRCYQSQLGSIERCWRMKRYGAALYGVSGLAEEFWQMDGGAYVRVHERVRADDVDGTFRGVRARPFTDPISYLRGLGARRRLRESARSL